MVLAFVRMALVLVPAMPQASAAMPQVLVPELTGRASVQVASERVLVAESVPELAGRALVVASAVASAPESAGRV